jgi:hypothetical protein
MKNELERMWKEAFVTYFRYCSRRTREDRYSEAELYESRELKLKLSEYKQNCLRSFQGHNNLSTCHPRVRRSRSALRFTARPLQDLLLRPELLELSTGTSCVCCWLVSKHTHTPVDSWAMSIEKIQ